MVLYKLMVVHLSIFTLSTQLMILCASVYSNSIEYQPFCNEGLTNTSVTSSLNLDLTQIGSSSSNNSCKRTLEAPEYHNFLIRLLNPKIRQTHIKNGSCPLYVTPHFSMNEWKVNPCTMHSEEVTKIFPGNVQLVWEHKGYESPYTIIATVLGKGSLCDNANKFPCLKIGSESVLCIPKSLQCDGIRQCPIGSEYENDEDIEHCSLQKVTTQSPTKRISLWNLSNELLRKIFHSTEIFTTESSQKNENLPTSSFNNTKRINDTNTAAAGGGGSKKIRASLTRGLSRYGPWGYLMLGMLICGTALLICGLWECCCKRSKPQLSGINAGTTVVTATAPNNSSITNESVVTGAGTVNNQQPPSYEDENDLPPSYSVLFPNQKENIQSDSGNPSTIPPIAFI